MDFAVYWYDINAFVHSGTPLYGPHSAFGFPMLFRYPPPFVLLFHPLSLLSFRAAGCVWAIAEALTITAIAYWMYVKLQLAVSLKTGLMALAICAPYFYLSFKDGNMQWFVTMLVLVAVLSTETRPPLAGLMLALGIVIKVWPILFVPMFLMRERRKSLLGTAAWSAAIWAFPLLAFGPTLYGRLLQDWSRQEFANHVGLCDIWYPSQSLRGVLLRFFASPGRTLPYHSEFPDVHVLTLPPGLLIMIWIVVSAAAFLYVTRRIWLSTGVERTQWDLCYFVVFSALQPFCNWSSLISLTPAVLMASHICSKKEPENQLNRTFFTITVALCGLEYIASLSRGSTRLFEALGLHFAIMLSLAACLWPMLKTKPQSQLYGPGSAGLEEWSQSGRRAS
jgi:hypothetical protein